MKQRDKIIRACLIIFMISAVVIAIGCSKGQKPDPGDKNRDTQRKEIEKEAEYTDNVPIPKICKPGEVCAAGGQCFNQSPGTWVLASVCAEVPVIQETDCTCIADTVCQGRMPGAGGAEGNESDAAAPAEGETGGEPSNIPEAWNCRKYDGTEYKLEEYDAYMTKLDLEKKMRENEWRKKMGYAPKYNADGTEIPGATAGTAGVGGTAGQTADSAAQIAAINSAVQSAAANSPIAR